LIGFKKKDIKVGRIFFAIYKGYNLRSPNPYRNNFVSSGTSAGNTFSPLRSQRDTILLNKKYHKI